jgi:hypothetical protein
MGLLSFIYWLITGLFPGRRPAMDGAVREPRHSQFSQEFFDATSLRCELRPGRVKISKNRRR